MAKTLPSSISASYPEHAPLKLEPRASSLPGRRRLEGRWEIPIIDARRRIVGWTSIAPQYSGSLLHHAEAERLVGGTILCAYIQIEEGSDAKRAGAPAGWQGAWRCLALCSEHALTRKLGGDLPTIELSEPQI